MADGPETYSGCLSHADLAREAAEFSSGFAAALAGSLDKWAPGFSGEAPDALWDAASSCAFVDTYRNTIIEFAHDVAAPQSVDPSVVYALSTRRCGALFGQFAKMLPAADLGRAMPLGTVPLKLLRKAFDVVAEQALLGAAWWWRGEVALGAVYRPESDP